MGIFEVKLMVGHFISKTEIAFTHQFLESGQKQFDDVCVLIEP